MAEPKMGRAEPFRGQASDVCFSQSPWFCCDDIPAENWGGYVVQIEEVQARRGVEFNSGKAREVELFLKFTGIDKPLRVNVTIRRVLDDLISPMCADWFGKSVTLFVQQGVKVGKELKNGVRVKQALPPQAAPKPAAPPQPAPAAPSRPQAPPTAPAPAVATQAPVAAPAPSTSEPWNRDRVLAYLSDPRQRAATKAEAARLGKALNTGADLKALDDDTLAVLETRVFDAMTPFDERTTQEPRT